MKWWVLTLIVSLTSGLAWAESPCVAAYRSEYIELGRTNDPRYQETSELYAIYLDHISGVAVYKSETQRKMADLLKEKMEDGTGCNFRGWPRRKQFYRDQYEAKYSEVINE